MYNLVSLVVPLFSYTWRRHVFGYNSWFQITEHNLRENQEEKGVGMVYFKLVPLPAQFTMRHVPDPERLNVSLQGNLYDLHSFAVGNTDDSGVGKPRSKCIDAGMQCTFTCKRKKRKSKIKSTEDFASVAKILITQVLSSPDSYIPPPDSATVRDIIISLAKYARSIEEILARSQTSTIGASSRACHRPVNGYGCRKYGRNRNKKFRNGTVALVTVPYTVYVFPRL
ncbi:hypothetical protein BT96DRAFT_1063108 [Gymnopus androsaceus JB14]|uniref:Uncharacterized protein n=1 Tax=Gymnopus androsaceus JB14 TaxID=1447944 RepID=A0A6A4GYC2_9AGAR|nr:hypothetical protein BT96DRAFT_1063108 [Gymnopus androsaceus JB14]